MRKIIWTWTLLFLHSALLIGCGSPGEKKKANRPISAEKLPPVEAPVTVDDGRLEVSRPGGWLTASPSDKFLVQFARHKINKQRLPSIQVSVAESPFEAPESVGREDLDEFTESMVPIARESVQNPKSILEPVRGLLIGDIACVRYVTAARFRFTRPYLKNYPNGERQIIQFLHKGRLYKVELRCEDKDSLVANRDAAYAVVASARFLDGKPEPPSQ